MTIPGANRNPPSMARALPVGDPNASVLMCSRYSSASRSSIALASPQNLQSSWVSNSTLIERSDSATVSRSGGRWRSAPVRVRARQLVGGRSGRGFQTGLAPPAAQLADGDCSQTEQRTEQDQVDQPAGYRA